MDKIQQLKIQHAATMAKLNAVEEKLNSAVKSGDMDLVLKCINDFETIHANSMRRSQEVLGAC